MPELEVTDPHAWSVKQWRSTSAWSMPEVLGELGRFKVDGGHASLFLKADLWIPAFLEAVEDVTSRIPSSDPVASDWVRPGAGRTLGHAEDGGAPGEIFLGRLPPRWLAGQHHVPVARHSASAPSTPRS